MGFRLKPFAEITRNMISAARGASPRLTDYQRGSVARTLLEAPAVVVEDLYHEIFLGLKAAIPVATFNSFDFQPLPAARARGYVSVTSRTPRADSFTIPDGTEFLTLSGARYISLGDVVWASGESAVVVRVEAEFDGMAGNAPAGAIIRSPAFDGAPVTISNQAMTSGRDAESLDERSARFADFIAALSRGTMTACLYAAKQATVLDASGRISEYVTRSSVDERQGAVRIYLASAIGAPSPQLLANAQRILDGWEDPDTGLPVAGFRPVGVNVTVLPMTVRVVRMSISVGLLPGRVMSTAITQSLNQIFTGMIQQIPSGAVLPLGKMVEALLSAPGVRSIVPHTTENFVCGADEILDAGPLSITTGGA